MIGESLKQQREFAQISQRELSKKTGIKQANISRWENDIQSPQIDYCIQLAKFYGITLDELVGLSNVPTRNSIPAKASSKAVTIASEYEDLFEDKNFVNTAKLFREITPELRALALGYLVGLLQNNGVNTKKVLSY